MKPLPYDRPDFLEPPHDHDPANVSNITNLPVPVSAALPSGLRELLPAVQEATSIVFASFTRLEDLLSQRLQRLTVFPAGSKRPGTGGVLYSEPAYFLYQRQVKNEAQYLVTEALPDWKHKLLRVENECFRRRIELNPEIAQAGAEMEFAKWVSNLKEEVQDWRRIAEAVEVPNFDEAVADLMAMQVRKASPSPNVSQASPGGGGGSVVKPEGEGVWKIEKIDSGIEF